MRRRTVVGLSGDRVRAARNLDGRIEITAQVPTSATTTTFATAVLPPNQARRFALTILELLSDGPIPCGTNLATNPPRCAGTAGFGTSDRCTCGSIGAHKRIARGDR